MPNLKVGRDTIPYEIKHSSRAKRLRITVRPEEVRVIAPRFTLRRDIVAFVESKSHWIYEKTLALRERRLVAIPGRFVSGAKVLFRGRFLRLWVEATRSCQSTNSLRFANAFHVTVEQGLSQKAREREARALVMAWLEGRALKDARGWSRQYGRELGVYPTRIRIGNQKTLWGSCSARGVVSLNWRLVAMPKPVFEYVVVHELCHLVERSHRKKFWKLVGSLLPDYRARKAHLQRHGVALG
jgi:predicted metal-dependent hydrolase